MNLNVAAKPQGARSALARGLAALVIAGLCLFVTAVSSARADGGNSIATATAVTFGQQEFGNTATGSNFEECYRSFWALHVAAGDLLTIDWESNSSDTILFLKPIGTTDFTLFSTANAAEQDLESNGKNELTYTSPAAGSVPMYFRNCHTPGPYDFKVADQHALVAALKSYPHIRSTTVVSGTANLADGTPAPDGLLFTLTATWSGGGIATYVAPSSAGKLAFPLALPETALGKKATFVVTRPADALYQAAKSSKLEVVVAKPRVTVEVSACERATRSARSLARQYRRLRFHASVAQGANRRRLHHRAHRVGRELRAAKARARRLCAAA